MATKNDVVVKLALVFFISLLSFSIGTFVGKKYSDNQHQLSQLEPKKGEKADREISSVSEEGEETKTGHMSDEEIAKLAEEFVSDDTKPSTEGATEGNKESTHENGKEASKESAKSELNTKEEKSGHHEVATSETKHNSEATHHGAHKESHVEKTTTESSSKKTPTALPKQTPNYAVGKFTVQIASYADENEAQNSASDLKEKGYSAFYIPANIKGKTWYRVSVGQFATQKEATTFRLNLINKEKVTTAIVQKITE